MFSVKIIISFILTFLLAMVLSNSIIRLIKRIGIRQTTLFYVDNHNSKNGTPTMGGIIFIVPITIIALIYIKSITLIGSIAIFVMLSFSLIGFLDDFLKVKRMKNLGLKAYQKIIAQSLIIIVVSLYCYYHYAIGSSVFIPFLDIYLDLKWWYIPFTFVVFIATTNSVNLTDGLDGLATKTAIAYFSTFLIILILLNFKSPSQNTESLILFSSCTLGGLFAFLWQNAYPAKIFMGDTGSLALGGGVACVAIFSKNPFLILVIGIIYVVTSISVIMQVVSFKLTGKRIFKMAPLHHHLEYKGIKESKIVSYYTIITIFFGVISVWDLIRTL